MALIKTPDGGFYFDDSQVDVDYETNVVTILGGGDEPGEAGVASFNGRTGAVVPANGDYTPEMVGAVPVTRTVNGKALSDNIQLTANDVGAADSETLNNVSEYAHDIVDGVERITGALYADGGEFEAGASYTGSDELTFGVSDTSESATVGITPESVTLVHNTNSDADANVRVASQSVEVKGGTTTVTVNGSGVNFGGAVLTGVNSIGGNEDTELAVESVMDMNNHKITGLANGTDATDAATVGQIPTAVINSLPSQMFVDLVNVQRTATTNTAEIQIATKQEDGTYSTAVQHGVLTLIGAGQGVDGVNGAGLMIASDKAKLDGIPTPTTGDNGKVLCVENGAYVLKTLAELQG